MAAVAEQTPPPQAPASDDPELEFLASGTLARRQPAAGNSVAGSGSEAAAAGPAGRPTRQFYFRQNADYDSLIEACRRKLAAQPGNTRALMIRANAFAKKGERLAVSASAGCMVVAASAWCMVVATAHDPGLVSLALLDTIGMPCMLVLQACCRKLWRTTLLCWRQSRPMWTRLTSGALHTTSWAPWRPPLRTTPQRCPWTRGTPRQRTGELPATTWRATLMPPTVRAGSGRVRAAGGCCSPSLLLGSNCRLLRCCTNLMRLDPTNPLPICSSCCAADYEQALAVDATLPDWRRRTDRTPPGKLSGGLGGLADTPIASAGMQLPEAPPSSSAAGGRAGVADSPCSTASGASRPRARRSSQADATPAVSHFSIAAVLKPGSTGTAAAAAGTAAAAIATAASQPGTAAAKQLSPLATPGKQLVQPGAAAATKAAPQPAVPASCVQQRAPQQPAGPQQQQQQHRRQVSITADGTTRAHRRSGSTASASTQPASADSSGDASAWLPSVRTHLADMSLQDGGSASVPLEVGASPQRAVRAGSSDAACQQQAQARELEPPQQAQQPAQQGQQGQLSADDYHARGYALRKRGDFAGAVREYSAALALDPSHFKCLFNRAFSLDKVGACRLGAGPAQCLGGCVASSLGPALACSAHPQLPVLCPPITDHSWAITLRRWLTTRRPLPWTPPPRMRTTTPASCVTGWATMRELWRPLAVLLHWRPTMPTSTT